MLETNPRIREIPYNYTSLSDREIVIRILDESAWDVLNQLRSQRRTGRSARMLFEVLGDMWVVQRNPLIQDDLLANPKRLGSLIHALHHRLDQIVYRAGGDNTEANLINPTRPLNELALQLSDQTRIAVKQFEAWLAKLKHRRQEILTKLSKITRRDNILFDGLSRVSHVTDATDWRVEYPQLVITPDTEIETLQIVQACIELGLTIIPRGGGTGYTGGAIPLDPETAVINTEKLDTIGALKQQQLPGVTPSVATVEVGAGVVTRRVSEFASQHDLVFAIDPTSQDASTIGGNISVNAGGKKAVRWGVTLDNLVWWRMVTPDAQWILVERLNHNLNKLNAVEFAEFQVTHLDTDGRTPIQEPIYIKAPVSQLRKPGLGKDVTNKYLAGLPGVQKEGCDGLITSACFLLHKAPKFMRTVCLEFFGLAKSAVPAILETKQFIDAEPTIDLIGSEHMDERYVRAVKYGTKSSRPHHPKMVLLLDIGGDDETALNQAVDTVVQIANKRDAEGFIAVSPEARARFWQDRSRTAAIAKHTNAFKINEDVVIPLERLAEYSDGIERINIEYSTRNKLDIIDALEAFFQTDLTSLLDKIDIDGFRNALPILHDAENTDIITAKQQAALALLKQVKQRWNKWLQNLDTKAQDWLDQLPIPIRRTIKYQDTIFDILQRKDLRISYRAEVAQPLDDIFSGRELEAVRNRIQEIHSSIRTSRLFVATHMHAGDGNVHTNIPVFSNDYQMLQDAEMIVERIMQLATSLGGVISGEHGIGLTKFRFLSPENISEFTKYKQAIDPQGHFNKGKLLVGSGLEHAYTPSLRLVQQESLILQATELGELNDMIRHCLRCGKCKPVCTTHVPRANLLYSPRNKILLAGLIMEAVLYEEQTRRGISLRHFDALNDVADHCTVCQRCFKPCPVNIDFAAVTSRMRAILYAQGKKHFNPLTWTSMQFLKVTDPTIIGWLRWGLIRNGYGAQRLAHATAKRLGLLGKPKLPAATFGAMTPKAQIVNFVKRPMPAQIHRAPMRRLLGVDDATKVAIIRNTKVQPDEDKNAVFYFPGCGSERLFTQIGLATLAMLHHVGAETVLAPGYMCCGYPQLSSGDYTTGQRITTDNRILFHRVANTLNYLDIKTVIVSCGTCLDQLLDYQFERIFPGAKLLDIHEYLADQGMALDGTQAAQYLYHNPCHSPIKTRNAVGLATYLMGKPVPLSDRCCGEAGTFAISRPDIATQVRFRKQEELEAGISKLTGSNKVKLLTTCPACLQGLNRYRDQINLEADYIVTELARHILGQNWETNFLNTIKNDAIEHVLL